MEPLGVLAQPRMVGRALDREVERDVHSELVRGRGELSHILERSKLGMHRVVAARLGSDRPRRSRIAGGGRERVVPALAIGEADGMDRRQVDDVEADGSELGKHLLDPREPSPGTREEFVPGPEARSHAVDLDRQRRVDRDLAVALLGALNRLEKLGAEDHVMLDDLRARFVLERRHSVLDQRVVGLRARPFERRAKEHNAL